jgi:hypothetical protein
MYILFRELHWKPSDYFNMPESEKVVVRAFLSQLSKETKKDADKLDRIRRARK